MTWRETYDTERCPRCDRAGLQRDGADYWLCCRCLRWFSTIELKRRNPAPSFKEKS